ncbi:MULTISPECIES: hypothetical protein [unclassified Yoonia]|uniref:hypothetical protein n=1 Tax=unclassified Yoonia TaxID=2629118 RepID=UPI002AFE3C25|nr:MULTISPECIES: hypothetical protein [unclassified Yoonia]
MDEPMSKTSNKLISSAVMAVVLAASGAVIVTPLASSAAYAQGNSAGRGNSDERGRGNDRESRADVRSDASGASETRGRGALASELKGFNAAHASPQALANASPDSMPGRLAAFRNEYGVVYDATVALNDATKAVEDYPAFSSDLEEGSDEYLAALAQYELDLGVLQTAVSDAERALIDASVDYTAAYAALTDGVQLSAEAQDELLRLLGLR